MGYGRKLKAIREALGLTQPEVAAHTQVQQATISAIEIRDSTRSEHIPTLARFYGLSMDDLVADDLDTLVAKALAHHASPGDIARPPPVGLIEADSPARAAKAPPAPYDVPRDIETELLRLLGELTPEQRQLLLKEVEGTVAANRTIAQHYAARGAANSKGPR